MVLRGLDSGKGNVRCGECGCVVMSQGGRTQDVCNVGLVPRSRKVAVEERAVGEEGAKEHLRREERPG